MGKYDDDIGVRPDDIGVRPDGPVRDLSRPKPAGAPRVDWLKRILVCDDDPSLVRLVEFHLQEDGFDVVTAGDGAQALEIMQRQTVTLLVLDAMMPNLDGFETLRRMKASAALAHIPVLMLTAKNSKPDILKAVECGAEDYLVKPFDAEVLIFRIKRLLKSRAENLRRGARRRAIG